jgi:hypothetical protein
MSRSLAEGSKHDRQGKLTREANRSAQTEKPARQAHESRLGGCVSCDPDKRKDGKGGQRRGETSR